MAMIFSNMRWILIAFINVPIAQITIMGEKRIVKWKKKIKK
jgi:hypothetical protein